MRIMQMRKYENNKIQSEKFGSKTAFLKRKYQQFSSAITKKKMT